MKHEEHSLRDEGNTKIDHYYCAYACMCVHVLVRSCVCVCVGGVSIIVHLRACVGAFMCMCMHVCRACLRVCVCMYVCVWVCMCGRICIYVWASACLAIR